MAKDQKTRKSNRVRRKAAKLHKKVWHFGRYLVTSVVAGGLDLALFTLLINLFPQGYWYAFWATVLARICSAGLDFYMDMKWCFGERSEKMRQILVFVSVAVVRLLISAPVVAFLTTRFTDINATLIKAGVDAALFIFCYFINKNYVFRDQ